MPGMPQMTPEMMKMASEMMSNMTPADIERTARMVQGMPGALLPYYYYYYSNNTTITTLSPYFYGNGDTCPVRGQGVYLGHLLHARCVGFPIFWGQFFCFCCLSLSCFVI
jgi:hypothetical protein